VQNFLLPSRVRSRRFSMDSLDPCRGRLRLLLLKEYKKAEHATPGGSPISLSPNRRSLDVDALGLFHHSRFGSSTGRLSRELSVITTLSTRSLNAIGRVSQEDLRKNKLVGGMAVSSGNLQFSGIFS